MDTSAAKTADRPDTYAVVGNPVEHSLSPWIHQRFAELTGQRLRYGKRLAPLDGFADTIAQLRREGFKGCNVTVPFKLQAAQLASHASERVRLAQAANTLRFADDGSIHADNTDGLGLARDIEHNARVPLAGKRLLLLGAGGAAAGALAPLLQARPAAIAIANRTAGRAAELAATHQPLARSHAVALHAGGLELAAAHAPFDIVINATASSLQGASLNLPAPAQLLANDALVLDMMYGPAAQPFLQWAGSAAQRPAATRDGLGMLVEQAAEAFLIWRGVRPDSGTVLAELRQLLAKRP